MIVHVSFLRLCFNRHIPSYQHTHRRVLHVVDEAGLRDDLACLANRLKPKFDFSCNWYSKIRRPHGPDWLGLRTGHELIKILIVGSSRVSCNRRFNLHEETLMRRTCQVTY